MVGNGQVAKGQGGCPQEGPGASRALLPRYAPGELGLGGLQPVMGVEEAARITRQEGHGAVSLLYMREREREKKSLEKLVIPVTCESQRVLPSSLTTLKWPSITQRKELRSLQWAERLVLVICVSLKKDMSGLSGGPVDKTPCFYCRGPGFDPWSGN